MLWDYIFPTNCVACGREGEWWCNDCRRLVSCQGVWQCPVCNIHSTEGKVCNVYCNTQTPLRSVTSLFFYHEPAVAELIKAYKYQSSESIEVIWRDVLAQFFVYPDTQKWWQAYARSDSFALIPVPLYPSRERERGFNQAERIAWLLGDVARQGGGEVRVISNGLRRVRQTAQQARLSAVERTENVAAAFCWRGGAVPRQVMLVDDVYTTGATLSECARALTAAGVESVSAFTLARG